MPNHMSLPAPSTGRGPQSPSTADAFGTTDSAPIVKDEPRESADPAPASGEVLADRAAEEVFGRPSLIAVSYRRRGAQCQ